MTVAVYAGMFDPVTNGHVDIATRAAKLFDKIIISILEDPTGERCFFTTAERVKMTQEANKHILNVEVQSFYGLVTDYARSVGAQTLIRGLRMSSDFELEFERALSNKELYPELETVCLMTRLEYQYLTARGLKEVVSLGGNVDTMVPPNVAKALKQKILVKKMTF
ncbi:MAG: pantetheine-phosphate adenylyltransferase [Dehalococcoidales bacterium]|jgi:pantetheine-phosphate adenylyltransferase